VNQQRVVAASDFFNKIGRFRLSDRPGTNRKICTTLMFAISSSRREKTLLARERVRMAAAEQGRRRDHQDDG